MTVEVDMTRLGLWGWDLILTSTYKNLSLTEPFEVSTPPFLVCAGSLERPSIGTPSSVNPPTVMIDGEPMVIDVTQVTKVEPLETKVRYDTFSIIGSLPDCDLRIATSFVGSDEFEAQANLEGEYHDLWITKQNMYDDLRSLKDTNADFLRICDTIDEKSAELFDGLDLKRKLDCEWSDGSTTVSLVVQKAETPPPPEEDSGVPGDIPGSLIVQGEGYSYVVLPDIGTDSVAVVSQGVPGLSNDRLEVIGRLVLTQT